MTDQLIPLIGFATAAVTVVWLASLLTDIFKKDRTRIAKRIDEDYRRHQRSRVEKSPIFLDWSKMAVRAQLGVSEPTTPTWRQRLESTIERSELNLTVSSLVLYSAAAGLIPGILAGVYQQSVFVGLAVGLAGPVIPYMIVAQKGKRKQEKMLAQLPDTFDLMARSVRSGQTITQAILQVATSLQPPIAAEFAYCEEQQKLGLPLEIALRDLARRTELLELKIFVLASARREAIWENSWNAWRSWFAIASASAAKSAP
jgi:tight adherence protein B